MALATRMLYHSANGDRWQLVRDTSSGRVFIRHEANAPAGGHVTDVEVGTFLAAGAGGPEHQELLRLIGTLVPDPEPGGERQSKPSKRERVGN